MVRDWTSCVSSYWKWWVNGQNGYHRINRVVVYWVVSCCLCRGRLRGQVRWHFRMWRDWLVHFWGRWGGIRYSVCRWCWLVRFWVILRWEGGNIRDWRKMSLLYMVVVVVVRRERYKMRGRCCWRGRNRSLGWWWGRGRERECCSMRRIVWWRGEDILRVRSYVRSRQWYRSRLRRMVR